MLLKCRSHSLQRSETSLLPTDIVIRDELQDHTPFVVAALFSTPVFRNSV